MLNWARCARFRAWHMVVVRRGRTTAEPRMRADVAWVRTQSVMQWRAVCDLCRHRCSVLLAGKNAAQAIHALQRNAAAAHHAGQGVFGYQHGQAGFLGQQAIQVAQPCLPVSIAALECRSSSLAVCSSVLDGETIWLSGSVVSSTSLLEMVKLRLPSPRFGHLHSRLRLERLTMFS